MPSDTNIQRTASRIEPTRTTWSQWGMPPRKGQKFLPPVPDAPTFFIVEVGSDAPRPEAGDGD